MRSHWTQHSHVPALRRMNDNINCTQFPDKAPFSRRKWLEVVFLLLPVCCFFCLTFSTPAAAAACWSVLVGVTSSAPAHTQRVVRASDATVIHLHTYTFTHTQTHTYMYVYTHTHVCPHIQIYTHIHTLVLHSYIHTFLHPHTKLSKSVWSLWLLE